MNQQYHYRTMSMFATDGIIEQCACGATFSSLDALLKHLDENPARLFEITDGVTRCKECNEPHYMKGKPGCQSHPLPMLLNNRFAPGTPVTLVDETLHTWANWQDAIGPKELESPPYTCKCGEEFETHDKLMKHTAKLNPSISTYDMGRAGVGMEREAHENTLKLLRRARNLLASQKDNEMIQLLLADIKKECPVLTEHNGPDCQAVEGTSYCQCGFYDELLGDNEG